MNFLSKGILAASGSIIGIAFSIITQMILSRKLMPDGMGQYQIFLNFSTMATTIATLGIGQASIYYINNIKSDIGKVISNTIFFGIFISIILSGILFIFIKINSDYFGTISVIGMTGFLLSCQGIIFINLLRPVLIAQLRMREAVLVSIILPLACLIVIAVIAALKLLTVNTAISAMALGQLSSLMVLLWCLRKNIKLSNLICYDLFKNIFSLGLKLAISNIMLITSTSIGLLLVRYIIKDDFSQIGYYGRAIAICGLIRLIPSAITPTLYSKWSGTDSQHLSSQVERALRMQFAFGLLALAALIIFGKQIIIILYTSAFLPSFVSMNVLVFGQVLRSMTDIYINLFASNGKPMLSTFILGISIPIVVVLSFVLVPYYGIKGAAWAETISAVISLGAAIMIGKRLNSVKFSKSFLLNYTDLQYINNALIKRPFIKTISSEK